MRRLHSALPVPIALARVTLAVTLASVPATAESQTCMGGASFADYRAAVGIDGSLADGARSYGGSVSAGGSGPFASLGAGTTHDVDLDDDARLFSATMGVGVPMQPRPTTQLCPFLSMALQDELQLHNGERHSFQAFGFGASVGTIVVVSPTLDVVPYLSTGVVIRSITMDLPAPDPTLEASGRHNFVSFGAGFVFGRLTVKPSVDVAIAGGEAAGAFRLQLSSSFGRVTRRAITTGGEGSVVTVWVNTRAGVYHCPGSRRYAGTTYGSYMTERDALATGAVPAGGKRCADARAPARSTRNDGP